MLLATLLFSMFYQAQPKAEFYIIPAPTFVTQQSTSATVQDIPVFVSKPVHQAPRAIQPAPEPAQTAPVDPGKGSAGWDATNAPGMGVTCFSTTSCLNQAYGLNNNGGPSQPGYMAVCPDGTPAQGSCTTPEGSK
jgi:hypothetical protein